MDDRTQSHHLPLDPDRVLQRLDKMVSAGRMTAEEASQIRAAAESGTLEVAVEGLRRKHAKARVATALARGELDAEEAASAHARLDAGEDPRSVPGVLRKDRHLSTEAGGGDG